MHKLKVKVILGSTRPNRFSDSADDLLNQLMWWAEALKLARKNL